MRKSYFTLESTKEPLKVLMTELLLRTIKLESLKMRPRSLYPIKCPPLDSNVKPR